MKITEHFVNSIAPNENAIKNGKSLVEKGNFVKMEKSKDETFISGECIGSGKDNYLVNVDLYNQSKPVYKCTCPSRQFPCKHALGLLFAYQQGRKFNIIDIPLDIIKKREKAEKKEEDKPLKNEIKKVNIDALIKKINTQIEGLSILAKILENIIEFGLGTMNLKQVQIYEEQAKKLGDYYLTGVQSKLREFLYLFNTDEYNENIYQKALLQLVELNNLLVKGKEYLIKKKDDPLGYIDKCSQIEELLGNTWQLTQLKELGLSFENITIIQLAFNSYNDIPSSQYIDMGLWINLNDGKVYKTLNYRPFKAVKYIKEDDSCFNVLNVKTLYIYPGEINQRIRFEEFTFNDITKKDYETIISYASSNYYDIIKMVKNVLKTPLSERFLYVLLKYKQIGKIEEQLIIVNDNDERIMLYGDYSHNIAFINQEALSNGAILGYFSHNFKDNLLEFYPLSLVTNSQIIRLSF